FKPQGVVVLLLGAATLISLMISDWRSLDPGPFFTREGVAQVLSQARCGDRLISSGLSYAEVQYYLRRLNAPACLRDESFPVEIQAHPGWMNGKKMLSRQKELESEATVLTEQMLSQPQFKVWLFYREYKSPQFKYNTQVANILKSELDRRLPVIQEINTRGNFFDSILVY